MNADAQNTWDLNPASPISPQIYRLLRERIIRNVLKPGYRISESEIARSCNVSRQPVREAFIKLAEQGLLAVLPQRGTIVNKIDYAAVLDARFLREAIEADIVKILFDGPRADLVRDLRRQIVEQINAARNDPAIFIQHDERFHRTLADAAGKSGAWRLTEGLKSQMDRVRFLALGQFPIGKLIDQHRLLVDQLDTGDQAAAEQAIRSHLREVLHDLPVIYAAHPDAFDLPGGQIPDPITVSIKGGKRQ